jgi:hypothetical protein
MNYQFTKDAMLPVVVELTYEDVCNIKKLAELFLDMETKPEGFWVHDIRKLHADAKDVMAKAAEAASYAYPKPKGDNQ